MAWGTRGFPRAPTPRARLHLPLSTWLQLLGEAASPGVHSPAPLSRPTNISHGGQADPTVPTTPLPATWATETTLGSWGSGTGIGAGPPTQAAETILGRHQGWATYLDPPGRGDPVPVHGCSDSLTLPCPGDHPGPTCSRPKPAGGGHHIGQEQGDLLLTHGTRIWEESPGLMCHTHRPLTFPSGSPRGCRPRSSPGLGCAQDTGLLMEPGASTTEDRNPQPMDPTHSPEKTSPRQPETSSPRGSRP